MEGAVKAVGMERRLHSLLGNSQKLDGGAMFGNAPKAMWGKWAPPDDLNRINLACRTLLIEEGNRRVLLETGVGSFFPPKLRERFGINEDNHVLLSNLATLGLSHTDIDVVVLSHLHFDHAGGLLSAWVEGEEPHLLFPNASFVVGETAWSRARAPHPRDRASFIPSLNAQLEASGRLMFIGQEGSELLGQDYVFHESNGHTPGMVLTELATPEGPIVFGADLIPGCPWVNQAITMGYDRYPELLIDEKTQMLERLCNHNGRIFFTHDPDCAIANVVRNERGRFEAANPIASLNGLEC